MNAHAAADAADDVDLALSEHSPLLPQAREASRQNDDSSTDGNIAGAGGIPPALRRRAQYFIYVFCFTIMLGFNLQPAARTQLYEDVICRKYYQTHGIPNGLGQEQKSKFADGEALCKINAVQSELALIRGYEVFSQVLPNLLCTVPFGMLADRIGRRPVMATAVLGLLLSEVWTLAVCLWSDVFATRLVIAGGLFTLIGGGGSTALSIIHVMMGDLVPDAERTHAFLFIHAASVVSGVLAPIVSTALMETGRTWTVILIGEAAIAGSLLVLPLIPETLGLRERYSAKTLRSNDANVVDGDDDDGDDDMDALNTLRAPLKQPRTLAGRLRLAAADLVAVFSHDRQAVLLVAIYMPIQFARELFNIIGLVYMSTRFGVRFSLGNLLLSMQQAVQAAVIALVIPAATFLLSSPRSPLVRRRGQAGQSGSSFPFPMLSRPWSVWRRDRLYLVVSTLLLATGHALLGLAPVLPLAVAGLVSVALSNPASSVALSMLGSCVGPSRGVAAVYSAAMTLSVALANGLAPAATALFAAGLDLDPSGSGAYAGLPFAATAAGIAVVCLLSLFVAAEPTKKSRETATAEHESERLLD